MSDLMIEADQFASSMSGILEPLARQMPQAARKAVREGLEYGRSEWKANAPVRRGKYKASIKHHMIRGGDFPTGEIGSPTMPGLPHLLEHGHATIWGGRVPGHEHIAPAAERAFDDTMEQLLSLVEGML